MLLVFILGFGPLNSVTQTYRVWIWVGMEMRILHGTELSELDPIPDSPQWLCPPAPRVVVVGGCSIITRIGTTSSTKNHCAY